MILIIAEIAEAIGGILAFILMIVICIWIISFFADITKTKVVSRYGDVIADPKTFNEINSIVKLGIQKSLDKIKAIDPNGYRILSNKSGSKIDKLSKLNDLYKDGIINQTELEKLKKEII